LRKYITQHVRETFPTFEQRQTLVADRNDLINARCRVTFRRFAAKHGLRPETWRREYHRGATGAAVPDSEDKRRRKYAEYDPFAGGCRSGTGNRKAELDGGKFEV